MTEPLGVGVIVPYDFALDDELWRWAPPGVRLYVTRTPHEKYDVGLAQARAIGTPEALALAAASIATPGPLVAAYMCTSGSFVQGRDGEQRLVEAMGTSGIPAAVTTSGALIEALLHLGAMRIGVATPYDDETGGLLAFYLRAAGLTPAAVVNLGLTERIWTLTPDEICDLVRRAAQQPCDAVFLSCTNVPAYDLIGPLEAELGIPVLTANQVTMWSALTRAGVRAVGEGRLLGAAAVVAEVVAEAGGAA